MIIVIKCAEIAKLADATLMFRKHSEFVQLITMEIWGFS